MGLISYVKNKTKRAVKAVKKGASGVKKVAEAASKSLDYVDKVTDTKAFEVAGNAVGTVYGVPTAGSAVRNAVNKTQDIKDDIGSAYKKTKSTINSISGVYESLNERARQILAQTQLLSNDEQFKNDLLTLFF